jgi:hypothetical protein
MMPPAPARARGQASARGVDDNYTHVPLREKVETTVWAKKRGQKKVKVLPRRVQRRRRIRHNPAIQGDHHPHRREPNARLRRAALFHATKKKPPSFYPPFVGSSSDRADQRGPFLAARRVGKRHEFFEITVLEARVLISLLAAPLAPSHIESERKATDDATAAPHFGSQAASALAMQTPESKLRAWVDARYTRVPLREKDTGTKLTVLYAAYTLAAPQVHARVHREEHLRQDAKLGLPERRAASKYRGHNQGLIPGALRENGTCAPASSCSRGLRDFRRARTASCRRVRSRSRAR